MRLSANLYIYTMILLLLAGKSQYIFGQQTEYRQGKVTYVTPRNIYTEFTPAVGITSGDTLFRLDGLIYTPAVLVKFTSSRSAAGPVFEGIRIKAGDILFAKIVIAAMKDTALSSVEPPDSAEGENVTLKIISTANQPAQTDFRIRGRAAIHSATTLVNTGAADDNQRWRYTLLLTAEDFTLSGLTFGTNLNYAYSVKEWQRISSSPLNRLIPFDLYISYETEDFGKVTAGRKISQWYQSIGAVDGIQYESASAGFSYGAFAGSRPSAVQSGFDFKLFQLGAFLSRTDTSVIGTMQNTLSWVYQTNSFTTDRQVISLQHTGSYLGWLTVFGSLESDLYKKIPGRTGGVPELSSIYLLARARMSRNFNASVSYDARRNPVYYHTFRNLIDSSYSNPMREGARVHLHYRPLRYLTLNFSGGVRFRQGDAKTAVNFSGYALWSEVPLIGGSADYSYTRNKTSFSTSDIHSLIYRHEIAQEASWSAGFRTMAYTYGSAGLKLHQNMLFADLNRRFFEKTYLAFSIEESVNRSITSGRVYVAITQRF